MELRVTEYGEPVLQQVGKPVIHFDADLKKLAADMIDTMRAKEGAGLAAHQVDVAVQLFVMEIGGNGKSVDFGYTLDDRTPPLSLIMPMIVCNPVLESLKQGTQADNEGCLSFPGMRLDGIQRETTIRLSFQDVNGTPHVLVCSGFLARCCQHEYDHLQGKLFIEHASKAELAKHASRLKRIKRDSRDYLKSQRSPSHA